MEYLVRITPIILVCCLLGCAARDGLVHLPNGDPQCPAGQWVNAMNPMACATPVAASSGTYPSGSPPQVTGYSAANVPEAETVSNDCTFSRTGANAYSITCTTAGGGTGLFQAGAIGVGVSPAGFPAGTFEAGNAGIGVTPNGVSGDLLTLSVGIGTSPTGTSGDTNATGGINLGPTSAAGAAPGAGNLVIDNVFTCNNANNVSVNCLQAMNGSGSLFPVVSVGATQQFQLGSSTGPSLSLLTSSFNAITLFSNTTAKLNVISSGVSISGDNAVNSMAREPIHFGTGTLTSLVTGTNFDCTKIVKAITIENGTGTSIVDTSCTGGSTLKVFDCGSSAPANAACSGGTAKVTVTLSTTAGTAVAATVNSAAVAAGEYLCAQITTAGTGCTALDASLDIMARP